MPVEVRPPIGYYPPSAVFSRDSPEYRAGPNKTFVVPAT